MKTQNVKNTRGFTILELLVVIAIIVIITALTLALLNGARQRSRDSRRVEDIRSIETALNLYGANHAGTYPVVSPAETINGSSDTMSAALIAENTISNVPTDPQHPTNAYQYESDGNTYTLTFCLETDTIQGYAAGCSNAVSQ